jgi:hypothetical protein
MKKNLLFIFLTAVLNFYGQTAKHYSNEFLNIGVDAKALGMGNAVIAQTGDVTSGYWNPALLYHVQSPQVALMHAAYFDNIAQYDYMAYAKPLDSTSSISFSLIRFGVDNIMNTTLLIDGEGNIDYDRITYFSTADYALNLSIGRKNLWKGVDMGISFKLIYRHIGEFANAYGIGFDIGAAYRLGPWKLGLVVRDVTTTYNYWSFNEEELETIQQSIPGQNQTPPEKVELTLPKWQVGVERSWKLKKNWNLAAEFDIHSRFYRTSSIISSDIMSIDPALGIEVNYSKIAFLRVGVNNFQQEEYYGEKEITFQPNAGLGFYYKGISLDYALTNIGSDGFFSHVFSLKVKLDYFLNKKEK